MLFCYFTIISLGKGMLSIIWTELHLLSFTQGSLMPIVVLEKLKIIFNRYTERQRHNHQTKGYQEKPIFSMQSCPGWYLDQPIRIHSMQSLYNSLFDKLLILKRNTKHHFIIAKVLVFQWKLWCVLNRIEIDFSNLKYFPTNQTLLLRYIFIYMCMHVHV